MTLNKAFRPVADFTARYAGKPATFIICVTVVALWALSGPMFGYSDTWQLAINTSTTIITFLMVFLIQNTQNRDNLALQAKLDELIRSGRSSNRFIGVEHLTDDELEAIIKECEERGRLEPGATRAKRKGAEKKPGGRLDKLAQARAAARARAARKPVKATVRRG